MTFLEFVCTKVMGPAVYGSMWRCPFHDDHNPSFSVRPPKPGYKVRFKCWGCGAWGDEFDLIRHFHPADTYDQRLERIAKLRAEYEAQTGNQASDYSSTGDRGVKLLHRLLDQDKIDHHDLLEVCGDLNHELNVRRDWAALGRRPDDDDEDSED